MSKVKIAYEVEDGYVGPSAPHYCTVETEDFEGMTADQIEGDLAGMIEEHFRQTISWRTCQPLSQYTKTIMESIAETPEE